MKRKKKFVYTFLLKNRQNIHAFLNKVKNVFGLINHQCNATSSFKALVHTRIIRKIITIFSTEILFCYYLPKCISISLLGKISWMTSSLSIVWISAKCWTKNFFDFIHRLADIQTLETRKDNRSKDIEIHWKVITGW